jgi:hypothetical protein
MQLFAKGYIPMKDAKKFSVSYFEFVDALVALTKRISFHILYILWFFFLVFHFSVTM